jgi:hypothetical protein
MIDPLNIQEWAKAIAEVAKYPSGAVAITILGLKLIPVIWGDKEVNGKVDNETCSKKRAEFVEKLNAGNLQFKEISERLKNMAEKVATFYDRNDKQNLRILDEIGGKDGLKDRILTLEVKFGDYTQKNGGGR